MNKVNTRPSHLRHSGQSNFAGGALNPAFDHSSPPKGRGILAGIHKPNTQTKSQESGWATII